MKRYLFALCSTRKKPILFGFFAGLQFEEFDYFFIFFQNSTCFVINLTWLLFFESHTHDNRLLVSRFWLYKSIRRIKMGSLAVICRYIYLFRNVFNQISTWKATLVTQYWLSYCGSSYFDWMAVHFKSATTLCRQLKMTWPPVLFELSVQFVCYTHIHIHSSLLTFRKWVTTEKRGDTIPSFLADNRQHIRHLFPSTSVFFRGFAFDLSILKSPALKQR